MTNEYIEYITSVCTGSVILLTIFIFLCLVILIVGLASGIDTYTNPVDIQPWVPKFIAIMLIIIFILCSLWIIMPFEGNNAEIRGFISIWL